MHLARFERVRPAPPPTAPERMPRLSGAPGIGLRIERDDCTGMSSRGDGTREPGPVMAEAQAAGADPAMTRGAARSNHARRTAAFAARPGMGWHVFPNVPHGATAERHPGGPNRAAPMDARAGERRAEGRAVHVVPGGGSNPVGAPAYAGRAMEAAAR